MHNFWAKSGLQSNLVQVHSHWFFIHIIISYFIKIKQKSWTPQNFIKNIYSSVLLCSGLYMNWPLDKKTVSSITVKTYQMLHIFYCICFCIHIRFRKFFTELKAPTKTQSFFKISSAFKHYSWAAELKGPSTTWITHKTIYCTRTIISRGLYIFYPIFYIVEQFMMQSG